MISYKLLGTKEFFVIHHTNCGMEFFTNESITGLLENSLETAALGENGFYDVGKGGGSAEGKFINFLTITDQEESVLRTSGVFASIRSSLEQYRSTVTFTM